MPKFSGWLLRRLSDQIAVGSSLLEIRSCAPTRNSGRSARIVEAVTAQSRPCRDRLGTRMGRDGSNDVR